MSGLPHIELTRVEHRSQDCIVVKFDYNDHFIGMVRKIKGSRWSKTLKAWYVPYSEEHLKTVYRIFKGLSKMHISDDLKFTPLKQPPIIINRSNLNTEQRRLLNGFSKYLDGKRYSKSTIETYTYLVADLIAYYKDGEAANLTNRAIKRFIEEVYISRNYSISTQRQFISALKLFVVYYPNCKVDSLVLVRPKRSKKLPTVLSKEEVIDLIRFTKNLKHRAIIALLYSCGLRIGELIALELRHIDIDRRQLIIKNAKGRKDRNVILAEGFLPLLQNYIMTYRPQRYFVEGQKGGRYSAVSVRAFLKRSCRWAGITKAVTPHTLRHSYATHLLENGIDIRYIQELLGHSKPETTMIYTKVSKKDLLQIESPLDTALKEMMLTDKGDKKVFLSGN